MAMSSEDITHIQKLKDTTTYSMWSFQIKILFQAKEMIAVIEGEDLKEKKDMNQEETRRWNMKDAKAQYWIVSTIDRSVVHHIMTCKTAKEMFQKLKLIYEKDTETQKCQLLQEFYAYKYDRSKDVMTNMSNLQNIAYRLNGLKQPVDDLMIMTKMMSILPDNFRHFSSAWDSVRGPDKTIEDLCARLQIEESKLKTENETDVVSFAANYKNGKINYKKDTVCFLCKEKGHVKSRCPKRGCTICKRTNHNEKDCFFREKSCKICKKTNHDEKNCFFKNKGQNNEKRYRDRDSRKDKLAFFADSEANLNHNNIFEFVIDSGATKHMVNSIEMVKNLRKCNENVKVAKKDSTMTVKGVGTLDLNKCKLKEVLCVPELTKNLMSVSEITENNGTVLFTKDSVQILTGEIPMPKQNIVIEGKKRANGMFVVDLNGTDEAMLTQTVNVGMDWHRKMGHLNFKSLKKIASLCDGVPKEIANIDENNFCAVCVNAKQTRFPFKTERMRATRILQIIHTDVCGPFEIETHDRKRYFVTMIDDFSHFCTVFLIRYKSEVSECLKQFVNSVENQFNKKVSVIRCDNGREYCALELQSWCKNKGIVLEYTVPYTPQLNGKAERMNRTLLEKARSLIFDANLPKEMWGDAILTAAYITNRCSSTTVDRTPVELWFGYKPNLKGVQIFGCKAYAKVLKPLKKMDNRSRECIFIGYARNAYRLWDPEKKASFCLYRDVIFEKSPTKNKSHICENQQDVGRVRICNSIENLDKEKEEVEESKEKNLEESRESEEDLDEDMRKNNEREETRNKERNEPEVRDEERDSTTRNLRPRVNLRTPSRYKNYAMRCETDEVSLTYSEIMETEDKEKWKLALKEEKDSLLKNNTWEIVEKERAAGKQILTNKWIFKRKEDGRYKARLVVRAQTAHW